MKKSIFGFLIFIGFSYYSHSYAAAIRLILPNNEATRSGLQEIFSIQGAGSYPFDESMLIVETDGSVILSASALILDQVDSYTRRVKTKYFYGLKAFNDTSLGADLKVSQIFVDRLRRKNRTLVFDPGHEILQGTSLYSHLLAEQRKTHKNLFDRSDSFSVDKIGVHMATRDGDVLSLKLAVELIGIDEESPLLEYKNLDIKLKSYNKMRGSLPEISEDNFQEMGLTFALTNNRHSERMMGLDQLGKYHLSYAGMISKASSNNCTAPFSDK